MATSLQTLLSFQATEFQLSCRYSSESRLYHHSSKPSKLKRLFPGLIGWFRSASFFMQSLLCRLCWLLLLHVISPGRTSLRQNVLVPPSTK